MHVIFHYQTHESFVRIKFVYSASALLIFVCYFSSWIEIKPSLISFIYCVQKTRTAVLVSLHINRNLHSFIFNFSYFDNLLIITSAAFYRPDISTVWIELGICVIFVLYSHRKCWISIKEVLPSVIRRDFLRDNSNYYQTWSTLIDWWEMLRVSL